jgi:hypothetical protein
MILTNSPPCVSIRKRVGGIYFFNCNTVIVKSPKTTVTAVTVPYCLV